MSLQIPKVEQLKVLLRHILTENPHDEQVLRLAKGLLKALDRWRGNPSPTRQHDQARNGLPRAPRLAPANASLASLGARCYGANPRTEGTD
jgi:hypothetical protein